ncbi:hypothetical protein B481_2489 [Planococcus halocryophilus Or1]|uniref:Uncharacterized protein n=1 Tax=Planococcus halocryophilus TaxID=1215089 RepID=A0A1C7DRZ5_9BACL|nr:hypothetical protein [Planococcus halocryophilus]ANU14349.1 hypothetical protein BBI08_10935 [Planococcus halocryophilus]EMF45923.1 hypothetical protein B481_2489 [Planococcus halocryophilus Or1]
MKKILCIGILLGIIVLAGCNDVSTYDDNEVAATVNGHEITIGDLRFLYPDDTALDYLDSVIVTELIKQEVQEMNLDISPHVMVKENQDDFEILPSENTKDDGSKQVRKYAIAQANKLDMTPEEFQKQYAKKIIEQNTYINTYLEEKLGEGDINDVKWMEEFGEEYTNLVEKLVEENGKEIEVLID